MENVKQTRSAGGVVLNPAGQVLVVSQRGLSWSLPKGHVDPGENDLAAARREIREESGLSDLEYVKDLGSFSRYRIGKDEPENKTELKTIVMFLFRTKQTRLAPEDDHNPEARWLPREAVAPLLTHPEDKKFFLSILGQI